MRLDPKSKAGKGMNAIRNRLRDANPKLAEAEAAEREIDDFCAALRRELQRVRVDHKLHQEDLAAMLELTQPTISKIESGHGDIGLRTVFRYARALGLRPSIKFVRNESQHAATARSF
jgi:DNA-binding XRE family transcriptional regulator